jgi:hypothetical protein
MTRGRKRKHDPTIPGHIDQKKLPTGCYWNRRDRYWYALVGTPASRRRLAGPEAMLSELHQSMEALRGVDRDSLDYMLAQFHASLQFRQLAKATQDDYGYCRLALDGFQTKLGVSVTGLRRAGITTPFLQRLVDEIAATHPSKSNHVKRYLWAAFTWARQRGHATENPAQGIRAAKEKRDPKMPDRAVMAAVVALLRERGALASRRKGSVAPYVWAVAEIAYRCRMRSVEVRDLTDANAQEDGIVVRRRKGSRDNLTRWSPELHTAWDWLASRRDGIWRKKARPTPLRPVDRPLVVAEDGAALKKSALSSAWRRAMDVAIAEGVITADQRFALHGLKHRGITDTEGSPDHKQQASGHRSARMLNVYDHSLPVVQPVKDEPA